jgi:predicted N-acetyltransferase YhbS
MILGFFLVAIWGKALGGYFLVESEYVFRSFTKGDKEAVEALVTPVLLEGQSWEWKYLENPKFDPSLVAVAEKEGRIVGCNHWLLRDIKLSGSSVCRAILCGDIVVDPNHRKHGVGKSLLLFLRPSDLSKAKGSVLTYMFAKPELGKRLYGPAVGYIPISTSTRRYSKRWSWKDVVARVKEININLGPGDELNGKAKHDFAVVFHVLGASPLTIAVKKGGIEASEESIEDAPLKVTTDLATLTYLRRREKRIRRVLKALLQRKLKVKGNLFNIIKLYQNLDTLERIFG